MADETKSVPFRAGFSKHQYVEPSSSTVGFFQEPPKVANEVYEDAAFRRVLECASTVSVKSTSAKQIQYTSHGLFKNQ